MIGNLPRIMLSVFIAMTLSVMASPQLSESEPAQGSEWEIVTVDSDGLGGISEAYWFTSLSLDSNDNPHISYHDKAMEDLKYARSNGTAWNIETVDSSTSVGNYLSLALDSNDYPHISYPDSLNHDLKYAKWDGSVWNCEIVDSDGEVGASNSIALDLDDNPHIAYADRTNQALKYAKWDGSVWNIETADNTGFVYHPSLALDSNDNPHISYSDKLNLDLKYAKWDGNTWLIETVDSNGRVGDFSSLVLDSSDYPHIGYFDTTGGNAKYAKWTGLAWHIEKIDTPHHDGKWTSLALDRSERPHISYFDEFEDDLMYAKWDGYEWNIEIVDTDGETGYFTSLAIDSLDIPHIGYYERWAGNVKYATKAKLGPDNEPPVADAGPDQTVYVGDVVQFDGSGSNDPDAIWQTTTVDSYGRTGFYTSIALDNNNNPHISYHDWNNGSLNYAKWTGTSWSIETVDEHGTHGWDTSIALDSRDYPHISYHNWTNHGLMYAKWEGSAWIIESVDDGNSWNPSMALDSNGNPHINYVNGTDVDLKYAKWNGTAWIIETVDYAGRVGSFSSLALDSNDYPHVSYQNWTSTTDTQLKYATWNGSAWNIDVVESGGNSLRTRSSLALDKNDNPHVSYCEWFNWGGPWPWTYSHIKYAKWNGTAWNIETVVSNDRWNDHISMALDSNDHPHLGYYEFFDDNNTLYYAELKVDTWDVETVDVSVWVGSLSLALDARDNPHMSYSDWTNDDLKYAKKGKGIVSYDWDFGDGSPHGSGVKPTHIYNSPGVYNVTLTVTDAEGATDTDNCIITVLPRNQPPVADANGPYDGDEGSPIVLDGSNSYDPDGDTFQYRWDLDNDGTWDTVWSSSPYMEHTWGDDYSGNVVLQVSDGEFTDADRAAITVNNVAPTVELMILPIYVNVSLRIAGEKWHDMSVELYEDDVLIAEGNLVRYPGSPNDQMLYLSGFKVNISRKYSATVRYTPGDDPINGQPNGANPCWIVLEFDDDDEVRLHHTFNIQHPETYIWEVDLTRAILLHGITFEATAYDPGADDLTFIWDFGDGITIGNFYPNQNQTFPVEITEIITHAFPGDGRYTVTLNVKDDDGGVGAAIVDIVIP